MALDAVKTAVSSRYPIYRELAAELAPHLGCAPEELEVFPGSDDAIGVLVDALTRNQPARILLQDPNYDGYRYHASLRGIEVLPWPPHPGALRFDPSDAIRAMAQLPPALAIVTEPHGSFGNTIGIPGLLSLAAAAALHGHLLLVDTCYQAFADHSVLISTPELRHSGRNVLVVGSLSKSLGLADLRLGYVIGDPDIIDYLRHWRRAGAVSGLTLRLALEILNRHTETMTRIRTDVIEGRDWLAAQIAGLGRGWSPLKSSTNFLTLDLGTPEAAERIINGLRTQKIAVRSHASRPAFASLVQITAAPVDVLRPVAAVFANIPATSQVAN